MLLIIPGVIISFYVAFAIYAFADEGVTGMSALQRSRALVYGRFWTVLSRSIIFMIILMLIALGFALVAGILTATLGTNQGGFTELLMSVLDAFVTSVFTLLGVFFAAQLYTALKQTVTMSVAPSKAYPILGWFGLVGFVLFLAVASANLVAVVVGMGIDGMDWGMML